jgi:predicted nucleotidyltransferase
MLSEMPLDDQGSADLVLSTFFDVRPALTADHAASYNLPVDESERQFLKRIADRIRSRESKAESRRKARIDAALAEARRLTRRFREEDPELRRVILFGSLATGEVGDREPDIDLAVESSRYLRLVSIGLDSPFEVDVVDLGTARKAIVEAVHRDGKVLYAR